MYLEPTRSGVFNIVQLHSEESREMIFTRITKKVKKNNKKNAVALDQTFGL